MNVYSLVDWSGRREDSCGLSWTDETPQAPTAARGSSPAPRKAKRLERKSTDNYNKLQKERGCPYV
ncbi:hypothetical protein [Bacillus sp. ISL-45]|uniref:hypothetical protein n=1 Tax=Bacillus sp. ISL-45 TaxID=2819128 RepID=UPI001BEA10F4|nr:hypothetical protein [Bacillus sp. ISL-45]MBT2640250.1 hypothetical protein [Bacillus sp. ISL-39]